MAKENDDLDLTSKSLFSEKKDFYHPVQLKDRDNMVEISDDGDQEKISQEKQLDNLIEFYRRKKVEEDKI